VGRGWFKGYASKAWLQPTGQKAGGRKRRGRLSASLKRTNCSARTETKKRAEPGHHKMWAEQAPVRPAKRWEVWESTGRKGVAGGPRQEGETWGKVTITKPRTTTPAKKKCSLTGKTRSPIGQADRISQQYIKEAGEEKKSPGPQPKMVNGPGRNRLAGLIGLQGLGRGKHTSGSGKTVRVVKGEGPTERRKFRRTKKGSNRNLSSSCPVKRGKSEVPGYKAPNARGGKLRVYLEKDPY